MCIQHFEGTWPQNIRYQAPSTSQITTQPSPNQGLYWHWCKYAGFLSMIPEDAKARCQEAVANVKEQSQVDNHFVHVNPEDRPAPFSDGLFKYAAIQWL